MSDSHHHNNSEGSLSEFEAKLSAVPRQQLAPEFREVILNRACAESGGCGRVNIAPIPWWRSLPKPVAWAVAACWTASVYLHLTTPDTHPLSHGGTPHYSSSKQERASDDDQIALAVAWVERGRILTRSEPSLELQ